MNYWRRFQTLQPCSKTVKSEEPKRPTNSVNCIQAVIYVKYAVKYEASIPNLNLVRVNRGNQLIYNKIHNEAVLKQ